jgi:3-methyladenine DNA glycosylase AlkD
MGVPAPSQLARQVRKSLASSGSSETAARSLRFFKANEAVRFYGVKSSVTRSIEKDAFNRIRGAWKLPDALAFCDIMIRGDELEGKAVGLLLLGRFKRAFAEDLLGRLQGWIEQDHCSNWATIDGLSCEVLAPLLTDRPELANPVMDWTESPDLWLRRAALVGLVKPARRGLHLDVAYRFAERMLDDPEDLVQKACGWLLREAGKTDMKRLERFLRLHGPRVSRTTLRYAIERFSPAERKRLLRETRE